MTNQEDRMNFFKLVVAIFIVMMTAVASITILVAATWAAFAYGGSWIGVTVAIMLTVAVAAIVAAYFEIYA